jgi:hypothetical protein
MYTAPSLRRRSEARKGLILMVVLALLTAFAIVGLSFVLYADAEAKAAQIAKEAEQGLVVHPYDLEPKVLLSSFLGQLIFDADDDTQANSSFRGHSLARLMYGYNYTLDANGNKISTNNTTPFNGLGRLHNTLTLPVLGSQDEFGMVNYKFFASDNFIRDPERPGIRPNSGKAQFLGGFNPPYTYADANNMFLAVVDSNGNVLQPSYHRTAIFGALDTGANPHWGSSTPTPDVGKYLTLRPRPKENARFPFPEDIGGDVKNLLGNPGGNDSIWIDGGFPVRVAPNGKTYKTLFAPLIVELDSRLNLSAHGNILGKDASGNPLHISNTGWGPWTVNLGQVLSDANRVFTGSTNPVTSGRYGSDALPGAGGAPTTAYPFPSGLAGVFPPLSSKSYSQINFDEGAASGSGAGTIRAAFTAPLVPQVPADPTTTNPKYYPAYPSGYQNGAITTQVLTNHPLANNTFGATGGDRVFSLNNMEALLRFNDSTSYSITGDLQNIATTSLGQQRPRNMVTTRGFDIVAPGLAPALASRSGSYALTSPDTRPKSQPGTFPTLAQLGSLPGSDFTPSDGRMNYNLASAMSILSTRLDLNRPLPDYPQPVNGVISATDPKFLAAQQARQDFAKDIFDRLRLVTGADDLSTVPPPSTTPNPSKDALRWLAQLSVNIVDFIDNDDIMTPFPWCSTGSPATPEYVYGIELPRLVINEVLVQYKKPTTGPDTTNTLIDVWVELMNPANADASLLDNGIARINLTGPTGPFNPYQVSICKNTSTVNAYSTLTAPANTAGIPDTNFTAPQPISPTSPTSIIQVTTNGGSTPCQITPTEFGTFMAGAVSPYNASAGVPQCFLLIGNSAAPTLSSTVTLGSTPDINSAEFSYKIPRDLVTPNPIAPTILLQRLACPYLPPSATNPYVAVDIFQSACHDNGGQNISTGNDVTTTSAQDASEARKNPFSDPLTTRAFETNVPAGASVKNSFKLVNTAAKGITNNWLVHLDRYLSSPIELLNVSGCKMQELTHYFGDSATPSLNQYNHRVPWFDEDLAGTPGGNSHRLYRFFELIETRSRMAGMDPVVFSTPASPATNPPTNATIAAGSTIIPLTSLSAMSTNGAMVTINQGDVLSIVSIDPTTHVPTIMENVRVQTPNVGASPTITIAQATVQTSSNPILVHTSMGGRVAGKLNINTVFDQEIFSALGDPNAANSFNGSFSTFYPILRTKIHQGTTLSDPSAVPPTIGSWPNPQADQVLQGMGAAMITPGSPDILQVTNPGIYRTLFRPASDPGAAFSNLILEPAITPANSHPYTRFELLNKIFNNTTTRSNVFAVWLTVGFFECDANGNNLGQEIGKSEGKSVRHRMFAIVDRTGLAVPRQAGTIANLPTSGVTVGTKLLIGVPGSLMETVTVTSTTGSVSYAPALSPGHQGTDPVFIMPGNWGPQPSFDVTQPVNKEIVPYYSIIE